MRAPQFRVTRANGLDLAHWDWPGDPEAAPIVFCHATGFHGRCWDQVIHHLDPATPAIALDMRAHGRSQQVDPPVHWRDFAVDVASLADALDWRNAVGVGHSMGGYAVAMAAAMRPSRFRSLVLIDPVIMAPESYFGHWVDEHFARKRRRTWGSPEEMFERFKARPPFNSWDQRVVRDYCDYALIGNDLACRPEVEGSIYENCTLPEANPYAELEALDIPVAIIRSAVEFELGFTAMEASPTDPRLAGVLKQARDEHWRDVSHFIPMEVPERVARTITAFSGPRP